MLTVQLSLSIWWLMLALIPLAVLILAVSAMLPHQGQLHRAYEKIVSTILFAPVPGAPQLSFIKFVLAALGVVAALVGFTVWSEGQRDAIPPNTPLDKQLLLQAKGWRNQRNLYLTCLALSLWYMVYQTFVFKAKIANLLDERDGSRAASAANVKKPVAVRAVPSETAGGEEVEEEVKSSNKKSQPVLRKLPKPSAPAEIED